MRASLTVARGIKFPEIAGEAKGAVMVMLGGWLSSPKGKLIVEVAPEVSVTVNVIGEVAPVL